jgi:hypothetical protein
VPGTGAFLHPRTAPGVRAPLVRRHWCCHLASSAGRSKFTRPSTSLCHDPSPTATFSPCPEDHALLVALHLAASEFHHPVGFVDLELLFRAGLDLEALARRADRWKLRSALYVALAALRALEAPSISADTLTRFFPGRLRRRALGLFYALDSYPAALGTLRLGTWWVLRQTPLRDDLGPWTVGVGRYGLTRALERALARRGRR